MGYTIDTQQCPFKRAASASAAADDAVIILTSVGRLFEVLSRNG
jgi:hypothetical protein